jgi:uncharacterized protein (TIGR02246 family)
MEGDIGARIAKLEAVEEIRSLKARYAKACDIGYSPSAMAPLFTADAVWTEVTGRFGTHEGRDAICAFFGGVSSSISWALHYMIAPNIQVADDLQSATGTWYLWQPCTMDGEAVLLAGTYADTYRNEMGTWRISRMEVKLETITSLHEGWARQRFIGD